MIALEVDEELAMCIESGEKKQNFMLRSWWINNGQKVTFYTVDSKGRKHHLKTKAIASLVHQIEIHKDFILVVARDSMVAGNGNFAFINEIWDQNAMAKAEGFINFREWKLFLKERYGSLPVRGVLLHWETHLQVV
jgi:hypothetical protein